ncbi:hypothetical protein [Micromonospora sp. WMMD964]|uniref:hypothetical protein n=1 Tax=Micromonospora TaxID=1873 RepID=UPI002499FF60|nr:hypothetical protein [Micromonospora sp. WMMD964]WFF02988.1 hypothetical protein O7616_09655 [Micromonospora sp. WMMD964]
MLLTTSVWRGNAQWWFPAGLLLGGLTSAFFAVLVGAFLRPLVPAVIATTLLAVAFAAVALQELGLYRLPLPQNARQVPRSIMWDGQFWGPLQFGFEMGTGVRTYMTSGLPHVLAIGLLLLADWRTGLAAGIAFGAGRSWMFLGRHWHVGAEAWDEALTRHDRLIRVLLLAASTAALAAALLPL